MLRKILGMIAATLIMAAPCAAQASAADCSAVKSASHEGMDHTAHAKALAECAARELPKMPGQAAYAAIAEIVRILQADSSTDWTKVNIEALRQHLIDMDDVTMHADAKQRSVPGGIEVDVTGTGRTVGAIRRMLASHARMLASEAGYDASASELPGGVRLIVKSRRPSDTAAVARIRGLGFAGLLTEGDHHAAHHIALARGESMSHK